MRHPGTNRRSRNRSNNGRRNGPNRSQVFDSNGPEVRIRGTAHQICEKYMALAKDAASIGDVILAESYMQHAEHYQRMINIWDEQQQSTRVEQHSANNSNMDEDDLSLPESILTTAPETVSGEKVLENA